MDMYKSMKLMKLLIFILLCILCILCVKSSYASCSNCSCKVVTNIVYIIQPTPMFGIIDLNYPHANSLRINLYGGQGRRLSYGRFNSSGNRRSGVRGASSRQRIDIR
jgi:hypothetical protein